MPERRSLFARGWAPLMLALALAACGGAPESPGADAAGRADPQVAKLLTEAGAATREGRLPEAGRLLDQARARAPDNPDLWVAIARLRFAGGEHFTAIAAADRAVELAPAHAPALLMRAVLVRAAHGMTASLPWFEAALAANREDADAWAEYAATLGDLGRGRAMLEAASELARVAPGDPRIAFYQAVLAQRGGKPLLARSLLERSGMAARGVPAAVLLDALIQLDQGNWDSAATRLEALAERQPANAALRDLHAKALLASGRAEAVIARFGAEAARGEASAYLVMAVARAHERLGDRAAAAPLLARAYARVAAKPVALAVRPGLPPITAQLRASAGAGAGQAGAARALRADYPTSADLAALSGDASLAAGDPAGALAAYADAMRVRRPWPLTRKAVFATLAIGEGAAADTLLARHVSGEPGNIDALIQLAQRRAETRDWLRCAVLLDHAIALGGGHDPALLALRARCASALERGEEAAAFAALRAEIGPVLRAQSPAE